MAMRATYGMQLGTGTVDALPGLTYTGNRELWSWGAAYRGRFAIDDNSEGYHWGDTNQLTAWAGYTFFPGITATARVAGTVQGKIEGRDMLIIGADARCESGLVRWRNCRSFGGIEVAGHQFGLGNTRLAIEAGAAGVSEPERPSNRPRLAAQCRARSPFQRIGRPATVIPEMPQALSWPSGTA